MHHPMRNCEIGHESTENRMGGEFPCVNWPWKEEKEICCSLGSPANSSFVLVFSLFSKPIDTKLTLQQPRVVFISVSWDTIDGFGKRFKGQLLVQGSETWSRFSVVHQNLWSRRRRSRLINLLMRTKLACHSNIRVLSTSSRKSCTVQDLLRFSHLTVNWASGVL